MKTKIVKNLKEMGIEICDITTNHITNDGCYYNSCKSNKLVNDRLRSYGYSTQDIREYISTSNYNAKNDAEDYADRNNRNNRKWPYRMGREFDYSAIHDGCELLEIDEKEIEKLLNN